MHLQVTYLGCLLDETMLRESLTVKVMNKINRKLKFLYRKNRYLIKELCGMLCSALIQPHFDYVCPDWYPDFSEKVKKKIQIMQNRCILFCLKLDKMHHISEKEFRLVNWLPTSKRINQCINTISYNFVNHTCLYLNDLFEFAPYCRIGSRNNFCKSIYFEFGKITISCIAPSL